MKLSEIDPIFCEALAVQSIFMGFGIPSDDVYVAYAAPRLRVLARQGDLEFFVDVADIPDMSRQAFIEKWTAVAEAWNDAPVEARKALTERTRARRDAVQIIAGMIAKGFRTRGGDAAGQD